MTPVPAHVVVTAVRAETRAVLDTLRRIRRIDAAGFRAWEGERGVARVRVVQSGIGPERARRALWAMPVPHGPVLCVGFAGALTDAAPGDIVLPTRVVWEGPGEAAGYDVPSAIWERAYRALATNSGARVLRGPILSSPTILASPREKYDAHARTGAVAVEMETAGLLPIAIERGAMVLPVRTVLDTSDVSLEAVPPDLDISWRARALLVGRPSAWPSVWALARQVPRAASRLHEAIAVVLDAL